MKRKTAKTKSFTIRQATPINKGTPAELIEKAIAGKADLDKLEKLMVLQERYEANEARKAYNDAMATFKANPPRIAKDSTVDYTPKSTGVRVKYKYASLANIVETITKELSKYGLSASWRTQMNGKVVVTCRVAHIKGHYEETTLSADADSSGAKNSIQAIGSTITYLQRYTLLAITGLATQGQDDDGFAAQPEIVEVITDKQQHELADMLLSKNLKAGSLFKYLGVKDYNEIPASDFNKAKTAINNARVKK